MKTLSTGIYLEGKKKMGIGFDHVDRPIVKGFRDDEK